MGKTTTSAAIAAGMADRGKKAAVLTIDPARRLANSLGLSELGNEEARVELPGASGELWAMMLDAKRTFDELIDTYAPDEETRDSVLANPIYKQLSNAVAGSQEYMAMEKLHELHQEGRYDLLVLDTPPSRNALDFLEAPRRLSRFIDSRSLRFFQSSSKMSLGLMGKGTRVLFSIMKRATGVDLLRDLSDFFNAFGCMTDGFSERARHVEALLGDSRTTFLLVTSPREASIREAEWFAKRLREEDLPFGGVIVNRVRREIGTTALAAAGHGAERAAGRQAGREGLAHPGRAGGAGRGGRPQHGRPEAPAGAQAHAGRARAAGRRARPGRPTRPERPPVLTRRPAL